MKIIHAASELQPKGRKVCLAIGFFDGVHLGHQQIIRQTISDARQHEALALAVTFDRHPSTVVAPNRVPPLIYSLPQKLRVIGSLGVDALLLIHFDRPFSEQTGEAFIRGLARDLGQIQSLCVGNAFTFGHKRGGNVALLKTLGAELHFTVHGMAAVSLDGKVVSSTRIRETIKAGDLDAASQMLGRAYSLAGTDCARGSTRPSTRLSHRESGRDRPGLAAQWCLRRSRAGPRPDASRGGEHRLAPHAAKSATATPRRSASARFQRRSLRRGNGNHLPGKIARGKKIPFAAALKEQIGRDVAEARTRF